MQAGLLSRVINVFGVPTLCKRWKATPAAALSRVVDGPRAVREPGHATLMNVGSPTGREPYGDRVPVVVSGVTPAHGGREGRPQGEGAQVTDLKEP